MPPTTLLILTHLLVETIFILRVLTRPHREPTSRVAWIVVILTLPAVGIILYVLFGETTIGKKQAARMKTVFMALPSIPTGAEVEVETQIPERYRPLFHLGASVSGFQPVSGNQAILMKDSNASIDHMVADIEAAKDHIHLLFYIWLEDNNGIKIAEALQRAAKRGVRCRALVDGLGSRAFIRSSQWRRMRSAGVNVATALPIGNPLARVLTGRIDLRNHRKILVIDGDLTYCGSQNCADPEFRVKPKYAPWVDVMFRLQGPVARQNLKLFASDWTAYTGENLDNLITEPFAAATPGFSAQVIGTGPTFRDSAMPEIFTALVHAAQHRLIISTPYYVPNEPLQSALEAAALRGVDITLIFPERNDSFVVGAASRSYYADLLQAGVRIHEYRGGLLHSKTLTLDGEVSLIGSANMDRRSFDLNYENNILLYDPKTTASLIERQTQYLGQSKEITQDDVAAWSVAIRLRNNAVAAMGPIL
ncbi:MAG: cardiolipin synthase [Bdellovibrionota bacterium]